MRILLFCLMCLLVGSPAWASYGAPWSVSTEAQQRLDAAAFEGMD